MADKSITVMNIEGQIVDVLPCGLIMFVDTITGRLYSIEEIYILTEEELNDIIRMRHNFFKNYIKSDNHETDTNEQRRV